MNKIKVLLLCSALLFGLLTGCGAEDMSPDRDLEDTYAEEKSVKIQLEGDTATASSDSVRISGGIITIREEATYVISGELTDGMLLVDADETAEIQIVLDGATIQNETSAAIYVKEADKVFLTLAEGSENALGNGGAFEAVDDSNVDAALFSKQDLTLNGTGSVTVTSPAGHGIVCKDDLVCAEGTCRIEAASHGMEANDSVRIAEGVSLKIIAGKDGIHCENTEDATLGYVYVSGGSIDIKAEGDGISAGAALEVTEGELTLLTGGGSENGTKSSSDFYGGFGGKRRPGERFSSNTETEDSTSMKGMKAAGNITVSGGKFTINSADDAIHSDNSVTISGGVYALETGDDAVHAEDTLTVTACEMTVSESFEGLEAETIVIQGGTINLTSSDDGINAAGGTDTSGTTGGRDGMFGGGRGGMHGGGMQGGGMSGSSTGSIEISDGNITIYASGDGIDSNGSLTISGGYIYVANPNSGDTSVLDADVTPVITGGTFISTGATQMMAQSFSEESTQGVIACTVGNQNAETLISVADSDGNIILEYEAEYSFVLVIISSPELVKGETYTLTVGTVSGTMTAN